MAIDNEPAPSAEPASSDVQQAPAASSAELADASINSDRSWWQRLLDRRRSGDLSRLGVEEPAAEDAPPEQPASATIQLTEEELQQRIQRAAQAEADRRDAKRQQEAEQRRQLEERRRLRREDPFQYAQNDEETEQALLKQQADAQEKLAERMALLGQAGSQYDRAILDPIVAAVPEAERKRILSLDNAGLGLEGRKLLASESLKALEAHWKAQGAREAEQKLRRNPAFRKQVLAELRGQHPEPELLLGTPDGNGHDDNVSDILRASIGYQRRQ